MCLGVSFYDIKLRTAKTLGFLGVAWADSLADPDWRPVAKESVDVADDGTEELAVPANVPTSFYRLPSKGR